MKTVLKERTLFLVALLVICNISFAAPRLVEMIPAAGEKDVDPSLKAIRFVFDENMNSGRNYSICGGGDAYPGGKSSPKWVNSTTLEWPVDLKPNHEYHFSINCPSSSKGFRNKKGQPANYTPLSFTTSEATAGSSGVANTASAAALFQQGLYAEKTEGDLEKAIGLYEQVLDQASEVERIAARTLLQMAGCYEKKGDQAKAITCYKKIVDGCPSQKSAIKKANAKLKKLQPQTQTLGVTKMLPPQVWDYIGSSFYSNHMEAASKNISSNTHVYGVTENELLYRGGIILFKNNTGHKITSDQEIHVGNFSYKDLVIINQAGMQLESRSESDPFKNGRYKVYAKPINPIAVGEMRGIGWQNPGIQTLQKQTDGSQTVTMQNFYGGKVLETFFLTIPSTMEIVESSEPYTSKKKFNDLTVYTWKKEVPESTNNKVTVKLGKAKPANLQSLIDDAKSGDTVIVKSGTYSTPLVITKPITLRGQSFADCKIEVVSDSPAIQIKGVGTAGEVKLENITINWQLESSSSSQSTPTEYVTDKNMAFAVYILDSNVTINGCVIENKEDKYRAPGGIYAKGFSEFNLTNSQVEGPFDYAVNFGEGTKGTVTDCFISKPDHQGIMLYNGADVVVERNIITGSGFHGVRTTGGKLVLRNNLIIDNKTRGVYLGSRSGSGIIENNIIKNSGTGIGGFSMSQFDIRNNIISNSSYTGIGFRKSCRLMIEGNIFYNNNVAWMMFESDGQNGNGCRRNTFWANASVTKGFSHTGNSIIDDKSHFVKNDYTINPRSEAAKEKQGLIDTKIFDTLFDRHKNFKSYMTGCLPAYSEKKSSTKTEKVFVPDVSYMRNNEFMKFSLVRPNGVKLGKLLWRTTLNDKDEWAIESYMTIDAGGSYMEQYTFVEANKENLKPTRAITDNWSGKFEITYNEKNVASKIGSSEKTIEVTKDVFDNEQTFYIIRSMPLEVGYNEFFMIYPPQSGVLSECRIRVEAIEKVELSGNLTDCFKTKLTCSVNGQPLLEHTLWITTDPMHWIAKYDSGMAIMELVEYGVKKIDGNKEKIFQSLKKMQNETDNKPVSLGDEKDAENFRASGWRLFLQGKPAEAEEEFIKAVAINPEMENGWQGLGWAQRNQMKNLNAKDSFEKCLAINPKNAAALNGMGQISKAEGEMEKAEEYWKRGIAAEKNATGPMLGLATLYEEQQDYRSSLKYYNMWLKLDPNNQMAKDGVERVKEAMRNKE